MSYQNTLALAELGAGDHVVYWHRGEIVAVHRIKKVWRNGVIVTTHPWARDPSYEWKWNKDGYERGNSGWNVPRIEPLPEDQTVESVRAIIKARIEERNVEREAAKREAERKREALWNEVGHEMRSNLLGMHTQWVDEEDGKAATTWTTKLTTQRGHVLAVMFTLIPDERIDWEGERDAETGEPPRVPTHKGSFAVVSTDADQRPFSSSSGSYHDIDTMDGVLLKIAEHYHR